jgi:hypothetical protein
MIPRIAAVDPTDLSRVSKIVFFPTDTTRSASPSNLNSTCLPNDPATRLIDPCSTHATKTQNSLTDFYTSLQPPLRYSHQSTSPYGKKTMNTTSRADISRFSVLQRDTATPLPTPFPTPADLSEQMDCTDETNSMLLNPALLPSTTRLRRKPFWTTLLHLTRPHSPTSGPPPSNL